MNLESNLKKINTHGRRADSIVNAMLLHSREKTVVETEPVDLNGMLNEYIKLAYHSAKAKTPGFVLEIRTEFDELASIQAVPHDLGRVFINIVDRLSPNFIKLLNPGNGYTGGNTFFI